MGIRLLLILPVLTIAILIGIPGTYVSTAEGGVITGFEVEYFQEESRHVVEVLPDLVPGRFWLVMENRGIALVDIPSGDDLRFTYFPLNRVGYGAGPDSKGNIYLTAYLGDLTYGIRVFNTVTMTEVGEYPICNYTLSDVELSDDETKLYVAGMTWPVLGESYSPGDWNPNTGFLMEIDTATFEETRRIDVGQEPESIYLAANNSIYIDTSQDVGLVERTPEEEMMCDHTPHGSLTDAVNLENFERTRRFACGPGAGTFFDWTGDRVAHTNALLAGITSKPEYDCGLWILDPDVNAVVQSIEIRDDSDQTYGVTTGILSRNQSETAYVVGYGSFDYYEMETSPADYNVLAIDTVEGDFLCGTLLDFTPMYLSELDDGRIIAFGPFSVMAILTPVS